MKQGIVLIAHGSREPGWAQPIEAIAAAVARKASGAIVRTAYLELMRPSLDEAIAELVAAGALSIRVVPLFLGAGGHVKDDLPKLIGTHPGVELSVEPPIGEQQQIIEAIAAAIARQRAPAGP